MGKEARKERYYLSCELAAKSLLPAIRAIMAERLVNDRHLPLYTASKLLGLTPAAISNYVKNKRGNKIRTLLESDPRMSGVINEVLDKLNSKGSSIGEYYCILCYEGRRALNEYGYKSSYCIYERTSRA
ncbi:transcriptional regulator [Sulfolobales archaeon HS-7]|nr:transcriptional regulator [Sulfolobales archaeon HS-7]